MNSHLDVNNTPPVSQIVWAHLMANHLRIVINEHNDPSRIDRSKRELERFEDCGYPEVDAYFARLQQIQNDTTLAHIAKSGTA
jgi:hypothetical protein